MLLMHLIWWALPLAFESAGNNMPARMAMIAITTSNSISVKAERASLLKVPDWFEAVSINGLYDKGRVGGECKVKMGVSICLRSRKSSKGRSR